MQTHFQYILHCVSPVLTIFIYRVFNYFKLHIYYVSINNFIYYVSINNFLEQHVYNNMMFMSFFLDGVKFCLRMVRWFFSGFSGFRPPLMNDRLDISEIFLKGP